MLQTAPGRIGVTPSGAVEATAKKFGTEADTLEKAVATTHKRILKAPLTQHGLPKALDLRPSDSPHGFGIQTWDVLLLPLSLAHLLDCACEMPLSTALLLCELFA
jgi:hypothetical protein